MGERSWAAPGSPPAIGAGASEHVGPEPVSGAAPDQARADLQTLLTRAVDELAQATGASRVAAWGPRPEGGVRILAAQLEGPCLVEPMAQEWEALATLGEAIDFGAPEAPTATLKLARRHGLHAAAPVGEPGALHAVLLLGSDSEPPGAVRPRSLGRLASVARRLQGPLEAAAAAERLMGLDAEIRWMDRRAALGGLVAEIVHEIRNPLVAVKTFIQLLPERDEDPEFHESFHAVASQELRRIEELLEVVLRHGRPGGRERSEARTQVPEAVESVEQLLRYRAADREVELEIALAAEVPEAALGGDGLRQVLLNLGLNAIDAAPRGGTVRFGAAAEKQQVLVFVEDDGPGVPEESRLRLFEPFFSTKGERAGGLGLAITRRIVEEAGGRIGVVDAASGGARFELRLPAVPTRD